MKFLSFVLLAVLTISGCVSRTDIESPLVPHRPVMEVAEIHFHGDRNFTGDERNEILDAAETWNYTTNGAAHIDVVFDLDPDSVQNLLDHQDDDIILKTSSENENFQEDGAWDGTLGMTPPWGGIHNPQEGSVHMYLLTDVMWKYGFRTITIHEMGHALGLSHIPSPHAVMFNFATKDHTNACLTVADISEFCRVNTCADRSEMNRRACER